MNRNQQTDIYQRISGFLLPRGKPRAELFAAPRDVAHRKQSGVAADRGEDGAG
jgi:hypothetical protein